MMKYDDECVYRLKEIKCDCFRVDQLISSSILFPISLPSNPTQRFYSTPHKQCRRNSFFLFTAVVCQEKSKRGENVDINVWSLSGQSLVSLIRHSMSSRSPVPIGGGRRRSRGNGRSWSTQSLVAYFWVEASIGRKSHANWDNCFSCQVRAPMV